MTRTATLYTVGHSNRTLAAFAAILDAHGIRTLVDVRAFPRSRRNPHFDRESLEDTLPPRGVEYLWLGRELGAFRKNRPGDERHVSLADEAQRAYAEHMMTPVFARAVDRLLDVQSPAAAMCAERAWRGCHRALLCDYILGVRGVTIIHAADERATERHRVRDEARVDGDVLIYDATEPPPRQLGLFA